MSSPTVAKRHSISWWKPRTAECFRHYFSLRVRPTYDFKQNLLSLGSTVEVLKPESLRADMRGEIQEMMNKYL